MKATFENSVNVLVKAYLDNTLIHLNCTACAVGNLIRGSGFPLPFKSSDRDFIRSWDWLEVVRREVRFTGVSDDIYDLSNGEAMIEATGYTAEQLSRIEKAFESSFGMQDSIFEGLMKCVDVLADIHNIDLTAKESAKKLFVKP